jgi:hypothetical protein
MDPGVSELAKKKQMAARAPLHDLTECGIVYKTSELAEICLDRDSHCPFWLKQELHRNFEVDLARVAAFFVLPAKDEESNEKREFMVITLQQQT